MSSDYFGFPMTVIRTHSLHMILQAVYVLSERRATAVVEYFCAFNVSQDDSFNSKNASVIGLLDIYGFEVFQNNR